MDDVLVFDRRECLLDKVIVESALVRLVESLDGRLIPTSEPTLAVECFVRENPVSIRLLSTLRGISLSGSLEAVCAISLKLRDLLSLPLMIVDPSSGAIVDLEDCEVVDDIVRRISE